MRDLKRNQQSVKVSYYGTVSTTDDWGNTVKAYSTPEFIDISVSTGKEKTDYTPYGSDLKYDREMVTFDLNCKIDNDTKVWIDNEEYSVVGVIKSLNSIRYAIKKL